MNLSQKLSQDFSEDCLAATSLRGKETMLDKDAIARFMLSAAEETFATMLGLQITSGKPSGEQAETAIHVERVVALIGLAGSYNGTGMISCSPALACKLASEMLMESLSAVDGEVLDAIGELSNMIFGNVKTMLEQQIGQFGLSIPTIIFGRNFWTRSFGEHWIVVPIEVNECDLDLRMCLLPNSTRSFSGLHRKHS